MTVNVDVYRIEQLEKKMLAQEKKLEEQAASLQTAHIQIARLSERLTIFQLAQAIFSSAASSLAAIVGALK